MTSAVCSTINESTTHRQLPGTREREDRMRITLLLVAAAAAAPSAGWVDFGLDSGTAASVSVVEATPAGLVIDVTVPGVDIAHVASGGMDFSVVTVPGTTLSAPEPGFPALPKLSFLAALPADPGVTMTVESLDEVQLGILTPWPMQPVMPDTSRSAGPFAFLPEAYSAGVHPSAAAQWTLDGVLRGVPVGRFAINPFRWDAVTGELTAARRMRISIDFGGTVHRPDRLASPWVESIFEQAFINASILDAPPASEYHESAGVFWAFTPEAASRADGADLLILAGDDFVETMLDEFATAKHNQGYLTTVVAAGSWTQAQIKTYIQTAYDTWDPAPSFVLFVGDHGDLPAYSFNGMYSDNRYCCVDGTDYMCDIFRGRFTNGTSWMQIVTDKIMKWEFDPLLDPSFWNTALSAGYFQDDNNDGIADRWFLYTCETVRDTYLTLFGKSVEREYCTNSTHATPWYYRPDLPSAGQQVPSDITWDGNAAGITAAINSGVFLVQHRDHGMVDGWADPYYVTSNLSALSNGDKTPVVFSVNCLTGQFSSNCFSENLFRMQGGAVAVFAAVQVSYSYFNDYLCYGMYHSFNDDFVSPPFVYTSPAGNYLAGQALMGGHLEMQAAAPFNPYGSWQSYAEDEWDLFHVFGDPTMDMRTEVPTVLSVGAPATLSEGASSATFTVSTEGSPVEGALVCLRKPDEEIWVRGFTDASGVAVLDFPAITSATMMPWMVSSHNTIPLAGAINGVGVGEGGTAPASSSCGPPFPNPARGPVGFPVSLAQAGQVTVRVFDLAGRMVWSSGTEMPAGEQVLLWDAEAPDGLYLSVVELPGGAVRRAGIVLAR